MNSNSLTVSGLSTTFGTGESAIRAVRGVDLDIESGGTFVLLGESGSGKSVTARSIMRLYQSAATITGRIELGTQDLTTLSEKQMRELRGSQISMVPQDPTGALDPLRSVGSQLTEVLVAHKVVPNKKTARVHAVELFKRVGIGDPERVYKARPHQLSGGMRQRAVIAIAISCSPKLLIADEPTTALDVTVQAAVLKLFTDLKRDLGMSLLMVTHDVGIAEELGGTVGVMYAGRMVESGPAREVLADPKHPYTRGLLGSIPLPGVPRGGLQVIPGRPPSTGETSTGCAFAPRCSLAEPTCHRLPPAMVSVGINRAAACPVANPGTASYETVPA